MRRLRGHSVFLRVFLKRDGATVPIAYMTSRYSICVDSLSIHTFIISHLCQKFVCVIKETDSSKTEVHFLFLGSWD